MTTPDWYQADDDDSDRARSNTALWRDRGAIIAAQQTRIAQLEETLTRIERLAQAHAVTARARGRSEVERDWLDVCTITERAL